MRTQTHSHTHTDLAGRYYTFDLALPALKCDDTMATVCLPSKVVLLACAVREGALHVLQMDASPDEWKRAGKSIKEVRSTFLVDAAASE